VLRANEWNDIAVAGPPSFQRHAALSEALVVAPIDMGAQLMRLRMVKSAEEIEMIRAGAEMTDAALFAVRDHARPGMTEHELVALVESAYVPAGGTTHIHYLGATSMASPDLCVPRQFPTGRAL